MKKKIFAMLFIMILSSLLAACNQGNESLQLPAKNGEEIKLKTSNLLYQNPGSTAYSLGAVSSEFVFIDNTLSVKNDEQVKTYQISFDKTALTRKEFMEQLKNTDKISDIDSFDNFTQYNLCESNSDTPGYRLYVVDDQYWMGTLYKNTIWRVVSLDIEL